MPLISVVIPAYNAEKTILETLQSVCNQTFTDIEIIIINDGSKDNTVEVSQQIKDDRIRIISYPNGGLPTARNRGISQSQGEYISFIDADDLWSPDKLASQLAALEANPHAGAAYSWTMVMEADGSKTYSTLPIYFQGNVYPDLLVQNFIASGSNIMVRRQAILETGDFEPSLKSAEDWDYWLRLAKKWEFVLVPKPQIYYRKSEGAMSSKVDVMEAYNLTVINKAFADAPQELQHLKPRSEANAYAYMAELSYRFTNSEQKIQQTRKKLSQAIRCYPGVLKSYYCQVLVIKILILSLFTPKVAIFLLDKYKQIRGRRRVVSVSN